MASSITRLPAVMHQVRIKAYADLSLSLQKLFELADDEMFRLADNATNNTDQNLYFDAMREVRLQRRSIEAGFFADVDEHFGALLSGEKINRRMLKSELSALRTQLINMGRKHQAAAEQKVMLKIGVTLSLTVEGDENPLGVPVLCDSYLAVIDQLTMDIKAKVALLKLFFRCVLSNLGDTYAQLEALLDDPNAQASNVEVTADVKGALMSGASEDEKSTAVMVDDFTELLTVLSELQHQSIEAVTHAELFTKVVDAMSASRELVSIEKEKIQLVSALFEFLIKERCVEPEFRILLSQLDVVVLKVALLDESFFSNGKHVVRRLLHELMSASLGYERTNIAVEQDVSYRRVSDLVNKILLQFETDLAVFDSWLMDFLAQGEQLQKQAQLHEQRLRDAEDRKAKSAMIRAEVNNQIQAVMAESQVSIQQLPEFVRVSLFEHWRNVMFLSWMQQGAASERWLEQRHTLKDLVWSLSKSRDDKPRLMKLLPDLLRRLRSGFDTISCDMTELNQLFKQLETEHLAIFTGQGASAGDAAATFAEDVIAEPAVTVSSQWLAQADSVNQGMWFNVKEGDKPEYRCRLAAAMKSFDKYVFVNRNGQKVMEKNRLELAQGLEQGSLRLLSDGQLFDQALESVIYDVRSSRDLTG